ncbi:MAG: VOC family protein [Opitutaceae bacterium]|jgi:catechol 2,3-dioxygenase-like lactoylglutathione lyase family enzyme
MKPKISLITLGVGDLQASLKFYRDGLGFFPQGDTNEIGILKLDGVWLSLYPRESLAKDATVPSEGSGFHGFTLAHNVKSKAEVDEVLAFAVKAGARLVKPAQDVFWGGYSGYFADPDGFLWEVAWNPLFDLT